MEDQHRIQVIQIYIFTHLPSIKKNFHTWFKIFIIRWCSKDDDCENLPVTDGGDGSNGLCFRHPDKDNIHFGICLKKMWVFPFPFSLLGLTSRG